MSQPAWPIRAPRFIGLPPRVQAAGLIVAIVVAELIAGAMIAQPRFLPLFAAAGAICVLALVFRFPFAAACGVLIVGASILHAARYKVAVGPSELRLEELVLGALAVVALVRPRRDTWGGAAGAALAAFFGFLASATIVAVQAGRTDFTEAFGMVRPLAMLAVFWVVIRLFPDRRDVIRLLVAGAVIAGITGLLSLLAAPPASPLDAVLNDPTGQAIRDDEGLGLVNRVRLPGVWLGYALFWFVAVLAVTKAGGRRLPWALLLGVISAGIVISLNRSMWIGIALGFVVMVVFGTTVRRQLLAVPLSLLALALVAGMTSASIDHDSPLAPIVDRGASLLDPGETEQTSTIRDRERENRFALDAIGARPTTGVGPGAPFGLRVGDSGSEGPVPVRVDVISVHNSYLHLALMGGLPLLAAFLVFLGAALANAYRFRRDPIVVSLGAGVIVLSVSALISQVFTSVNTMTTLGLVTGAIFVLTAPPRTHP